MNNVTTCPLGKRRNINRMNGLLLLLLLTVQICDPLTQMNMNSLLCHFVYYTLVVFLFVVVMETEIN